MEAIKKAGAIVFAGWVLLAPPLYAGDDAGIKLSRGLTNVFASPVEYYTQTAKLSGKHDPLTTLFGGFAKGTCMMVARIGTGLYDVVTFPVPVPRDYGPVMQPPTVLDAASQEYSQHEDF